jgi:hypothetical protein
MRVRCDAALARGCVGVRAPACVEQGITGMPRSSPEAVCGPDHPPDDPTDHHRFQQELHMLRPHHDGGTTAACSTAGQGGSDGPGRPRGPARRAAATRLAAVLGLLTALVAAPAMVQAQSAPRVVPGPNGTADVIFRDDCVVSFDARGRESHHLARCNDVQRERARQAIEAYRRAPGPGGANDGRPPQVNLNPNGSGQVVFRDGCVVQYDRDGDRRERGRGCSDEQVRRADAAMAAQRREQGWDGGSAGWWGMPQVTLDRDGSGQVRFRNGCVVEYNRRGERRERGRECGDEQARRADAAMAAYRREQGLGVGGQGSDRDDVVVGPDGNTEVRMGARCTVHYDRDGVRLNVAPACSPDQLKKADELETRFRIGRLNQQGQGN